MSDMNVKVGREGVREPIMNMETNVFKNTQDVYEHGEIPDQLYNNQQSQKCSFTL